MHATETVSHRFASWMERRSGAFLVGVAAVTVLLVIPMLLMAPDETASDNPGGPVYDLEGTFNSKLPPRFHLAVYIVEAKSGDILTQAPLWELRRNAEALRKADRDGALNPPGLPVQPYLFNGYDIDRRQPVLGIFTLADALAALIDLEHATDDEVKVALDLLLGDPRSAGLKDLVWHLEHEAGKSVLGREIDYWTAPAMGVPVAGDNEKLGGGTFRIGSLGDPVTEGKEHFNRKVQALLRGEQQDYLLWGIGIDAGLEVDDEVGTAVPFIGATFIMVLVVLGISLRSARVVLLAAIGLSSMIIWLKGLSNLVGLNSSTTLDFIVPIAMISLGADFAIHAVNRYREERRLVVDPRRAFRLGTAGVLAALVLATVTDAIAFLANVVAEIETVVGFAIGAGLAIVAAFVIMGLTVPLALMRLDAWRGRPGDAAPGDRAPGPWSPPGLVVLLARWRAVVLPLTAIVTALAGYYALQLDASFDVKEFFKKDSDFVVGLDKVEQYVGSTRGEPAIIYIEGDLADPAALDAIAGFIESVADNPFVAKEGGEASVQRRTVFTVLEQVMLSEYARKQIEMDSGVVIPVDGALNEISVMGRSYRWPGSREQLEAIYDYIAVNGVPVGPDENVYDALQVGETLFHDPSGASQDATAIILGIPGTREQAKVIGSRDTLEEDLRLLAAVPSLSHVGLTGSPFTRQASLDAVTSGLQRALVIAVVACLLAAIVAMRSVRFGVVTIIPIGLVVAWLYAFMYVFGFGLNFVTATIAAVSIGVGVDYAIHMTQRFREELARAGDRVQALRRAAQGTGIALLASAATSILGFTIMAFAPMPMFSSYGILTAVMIFMAAAASLFVLPSLLLLVTPASADAVAPASPE